MDKKKKSVTHYNQQKYWDFIRLKRMHFTGKTLEVFSQIQIDFLLNAVNIEFSPDDKILDICCGLGDHSIMLHEKTGARVEGRDLSEYVIEVAQKKIENSLDRLKDKVNFARGDMADIKQSIKKGEKFKLITVINSFFYLKDYRGHCAAVKNYFDILGKGGSLAFQTHHKNSLKVDMAKRQKWLDKMGIEVEKVQAEGKEGKIGKFAKNGKKIIITRNTNEEYGGYYYGFEKSEPDEHGIPTISFGRVYIDAKGNETDLGKIKIMQYKDRKGLTVVKKMMESVGFINVHIYAEPIVQDRSMKSLVIVGTKPNTKTG